MLKAVKAVVPQLKDNGYSFETVSEILQPAKPARIAEKSS
jgi:hypothetical protein